MVLVVVLEEILPEEAVPVEVVRELAEVLVVAQEEAVPEEADPVAAVQEKVEIQEVPALRKSLDFLPTR